MKQSMNMGGSIATKNILEKNGRIKWCFREESVNAIDNGWRFLSEVDTDDYLQDASNMVVCDWGTLFEIEPAIAPIFNMPVGNTRKSRVPKEEQLKLINECRTSGMTDIDWCREHGIAVSTFYYWVKQLRKDKE